MARSSQLFNKRKAKEKRDLTRPTARRELRKRALIVCEGEKTEVNYLRALVSNLDLTTADVKVCGECGSAPISVVEFGEKKYLADQDYDLVFFVFDKDSHKTYDEALNRITGLQENKKYKSSQFKAIISIPCFEIWFLLHFEPHSRPYVAGGGKSPCGNLISVLKKKDEFKNYQKGHDGHFEKLHSRLHQAKINSAQTLKQSIERGEREHHGNPTTRMHTLVAELEKIVEENRR